MGALDDRTLYEILDVSEDASFEDIDRAYRIASRTYQPGSAALYSVVSDEEGAEVLRRVERAFQVLSDPSMRREYDRSRGRSETEEPFCARPHELDLPEKPAEPPVAPECAEPTEPALTVLSDESLPVLSPEPGDPASRAPARLPDVFEPEGGIYDGAALHRRRLELGLELQDVSSVTKINTRYLRCIEGNQYESLPAPVFVKGFVRAIAGVLHLDARRVASTYMQRYRESTGRG